MIKVGHRGIKYFDENTLISFEKAIENKVDYIEFDVRKTKDNQIIVFHDLSLKRITGCKADVSMLTLKEIKKLRTINNQKIPSLKEVLKKFKGKVKFNIEIKEKNIAEYVCNIIKECGCINEVLISSFYEEALIESKKIIPEIKTALVYNDTKNTFFRFFPEIYSRVFSHFIKNDIIKKVKRTFANGVNLDYMLITKSIVKDIHKRNWFVMAWTVNRKQDIKKIANMGVDGIITDYPNLIPTNEKFQKLGFRPIPRIFKPI
ncbi:MAG: glycerophosphodiester phosphodiesterase [Candidatus Nanoarchaeia archaeon]